MSFNRLHDDECQVSQNLNQNQNILTWVMDPNRIYNCNPCRIERGIVSGNDVSLYNGNLVDLSSELRGQTRNASLCSTKKFSPSTVVEGKTNNGCVVPCGNDGLPCGSLSCRKEDLKHLSGCSMINYRPKPNDVGYKLEFPGCQSHPTMAHSGKKSSKKSPVKKAPMGWQGQQGEELAKY